MLRHGVVRLSGQFFGGAIVPSVARGCNLVELLNEINQSRDIIKKNGSAAFRVNSRSTLTLKRTPMFEYFIIVVGILVPFFVAIYVLNRMLNKGKKK